MDNIIPQDTPLKQCCRCKEWFPALQRFFHIHRSRLDGLRSECKTCRSKPKDSSVPNGYKRCTKCLEIKKASSEYFPGTNHAKSGLYAVCKLCNSQLCKEYRLKNLDKERSRVREYETTHSEYFQEYNLKYRQKHIERLRQYQIEHRAQSCAQTNKRRALKKRATIGDVDYKRILERDGLWCYICESDILHGQKIHFDHVVPLIRNGAHSEDNIKVTHATCNRRKGARLLEEMTPFMRRGI